MESLALSVSKSITDFLEQNEKRFANHYTLQQKHDKQLDDLNSRVEQLESRCRELNEENASLKIENASLKERAELAAKDMIIAQSDLRRMQVQMDELSGLMKAFDEKVQCLDRAGSQIEKKLEDVTKNQNEINRQQETEIKRQLKFLNATAAKAESASATAASLLASNPPILPAPQYSLMTPIRSPSTPSFLNGNNNRHHSSTPRHSRKSANSMHYDINDQLSHNNHNLNQYQRQEYNGSIDGDMIDELSDHADCLINKVESLKELQRSFGGSICSDE